MQLKGRLPRLQAPIGLRLLRGYKASYLGGDITAGLLVAALAVPQALGYATIVGVPIQVGLYTMPPALLAYALFGSSRVLFVGPVSTVSVLTGSIVNHLAGGDQQKAIELTSALAIMAGITLLLAGGLRLGWIAQFLNEPIVAGFVTGLVVLIVVGEIPGLLGLHAPTGAVWSRIYALFLAVQHVETVPLLIALAALLVLFGGAKLAPRVPWALVVLIGGVAASHYLGLAAQGAKVVGQVPSGLPTPWLPSPGLKYLPDLITGGVALAAVGIAEGLAAARTFAGSGSGDLQDDTELKANGIADIASGLFGGFGVAGSLSKTAANARAGAVTQMSGVAAAITVLLVIAFATSLLAPLPKAVLSAIVINAVWGLVKPKLFKQYFMIRRNDGVAALVAFVGVLVLGALNGLLLAIAQSLMGLVYRSMQVQIDEMGKVKHEKAAWGSVANDPDNRKTVKKVLVLRPDGPMFWANAASITDRIMHGASTRPDIRALVLDLEATNQLDATSAERLIALLRHLRERNIDLYLVRIFGDVRGVLERAGFMEELGPDRIWHSIAAGVKAARKAIPDVEEEMAFNDVMSLLSDLWEDEEDTHTEHIASRRLDIQPMDVVRAIRDRLRFRATPQTEVPVTEDEPTTTR